MNSSLMENIAETNTEDYKNTTRVNLPEEGFSFHKNNHKMMSHGRVTSLQSFFDWGLSEIKLNISSETVLCVGDDSFEIIPYDEATEEE